MTDYSKITQVAVLMFFTISTFRDLCVQTTTEKQIPVTKGLSSNNNVGPTLKFLYCYSCGYRKAFDEYSSIIRSRYPEFNIHGGNYDPPGIQMHLARALSFLKIIAIGCILLQYNIFEKLGGQSPGWWTYCMENKIFSCMIIFFVSNLIEGQLISTGAFEIILNDDIPVWSKLESGRIPQPPELFQIIDSYIKLEDPIDAVKGKFPK